VSLNEWHEVRFSRTGRNGNLRVDKSAAVEGMAKGAYNQLTLTLDLFIGGHRNFDEVAKNARLTKAFKGCIQKVVNSFIIAKHLYRYAMHGFEDNLTCLNTLID